MTRWPPSGPGRVVEYMKTGVRGRFVLRGLAALQRPVVENRLCGAAPFGSRVIGLRRPGLGVVVIPARSIALGPAGATGVTRAAASRTARGSRGRWCARCGSGRPAASSHWNSTMNRVMPPSTGSSYTMSAQSSPVWGAPRGGSRPSPRATGRFGTGRAAAGGRSAGRRAAGRRLARALSDRALEAAGAWPVRASAPTPTPATARIRPATSTFRGGDGHDRGSLLEGRGVVEAGKHRPDCGPERTGRPC